MMPFIGTFRFQEIMYDVNLKSNTFKLFDNAEQTH